MTASIETTSRFKFNPDVTARVMEGEAVLLNVRTGAYFGLNKVGTAIWQLYGEGQSLGETVLAVCARYNVAAERAESDVRTITTKLLEKDLLQLG